MKEQIAILEEKVAWLMERELARQPDFPSLELPANWKYSSISLEVATAVASARSVQAAADSLGVKKATLEENLKDSGIPHLFGEKWSVSMSRALKDEAVVDDFRYPESWKVLGKEFVRRLKTGTPIKTLAQEESVPVKVLARFLDNNGFNSKGEKI